MTFTQLMAARSLSGDEAIQWCSWEWCQGFKLTAHDSKATYRIGYDISHIFNEVLTMAKKATKNAESNRPQFFQSVEWVNVHLTIEDALEIDVWLASEPDVLGELCRLVVEGNGVAIKPAARGGGYMATLTSASDSDGRAGRGLSAFADTPYEAAACLLYKLIVKLDGTLESAAPSAKSRFR